MKHILTLLTLAILASNASAQCSDLFFSEYIEGSSSNKALEIYNPTGATVDMADYVIYRYNNGSLTATDSIHPIGALLAGDVFIIGNPSAVPGILAESDTTHTLTFFNGDDALLMKNKVTGDTLDILGEIGVDPGSGWTVGTGFTNNFTLIRQIGIQQGQLNWAIGATEWDVFPIDMIDSLGSHTMTPCASACPEELFFSEYIEGSSSNKAFEIYNPSGNSVDLSDYVVYRNNNGSLVPTDSIFPVGILASNDVFVVTNPSAALVPITTESDTTHTLTFFNGDDAVWLKKISTGDTLDVIGEIGVDPGSGWPVGTGATNNFTLIRKITVNEGTSNWSIGALQWDVYPIDMADSIGFHTMTGCTAVSCTNTSSSISESACDIYTAPDGIDYTATGIYMATIPNIEGCDSLITIDLTINNSTADVINDAACGSYTYNALTYTSTGTFIQTLTNTIGCDSIITLNLIITPVPNAPIVLGDTAYCAGDTPSDLGIAAANYDSLIISGVVDATLTGGLPKAIEFYVISDIADLSSYGFGSANNGGGTDGEEFTFPAVAVPAGTYIHVATDSANFFTYFNEYPDYVASSPANINGDDAIELFHNGTVIDVFGDINTDGTGEAWEYLDGWAYRNTDALPNGGIWNIADWTFSGINVLDGMANNAVATTPFPINSFSTSVTPGVFTWYSDPTLLTSVGTGTTFTPSGTTATYYVAETNAGTTTCEGLATEINVTFNALPTVIANASTQTVCEGENIVLTGSGADSYVWDNQAVDGVAFPATVTTDYTVIGTDANGCSGQDMINVVVLPLPTVTFGALADVCVYDDVFTLTEGSPAGGSYDGIGVSILTDEFTPGAAGAGTHTLTYEYVDGSGCTSVATSDIVVDSCLAINSIELIDLNIFPNPTRTVLNVESSVNINAIQIVTVAGTLVEEIEGTVFSVEHLTNGVYVLRISTDQGIVYKQFIKE
ncbi:MAG: lamin tail domain-containing protein [Crocinitomicaceae bacterium]|nr:lamin tail domain-containing protein [Crocinitomicaceae bacterium]